MDTSDTRTGEVNLVEEEEKEKKQEENIITDHIGSSSRGR